MVCFDFLGRIELEYFHFSMLPGVPLLSAWRPGPTTNRRERVETLELNTRVWAKMVMLRARWMWSWCRRGWFGVGAVQTWPSLFTCLFGVHLQSYFMRNKIFNSFCRHTLFTMVPKSRGLQQNKIWRRYHPGIAPDQVRWAKVMGRNLCRSRITRCTQDQGKDLRNRRCRLVVLGIEVRGGWSNEASSFIRMLTQARARSSPPSLRAATASALVSRWSALLSHLRCQSPVWGSYHSPQPGRRSPTPRPTLLRHQLGCADQSPPSPVEEGLDLHLPYQKHIWRLASIKTVCAWRLPSKTAMHPRDPSCG